LDIAFENQQEITLETYLEMVQGKTGALIAFAAALGGMVTSQPESDIKWLETFGRSLGLAFQVQDDFLGVWGDPKVTGKSIASDLLAKKKTLPVLYGLENCDEFREIWSWEEILSDQVTQLSALLESCGAQEYVNHKAENYTQDAFKALETLFPPQRPKNKAAEALFELAGNLLEREF
jgi:geranylgeranyl diphosphate synthase type I